MSELVKQTELQEVVAKTNSIISESEGRVARANDAGKNLLAAIDNNGMSKELDEQCNKYLVACRTTQSHIKQQRMPITQLFDNIKKIFTGMENQLDSKSGEFYPKIQKHRDNYAAYLAEQQRKKEEEAKRKLAADNERAELRTKVKTDVYIWLEDQLSKRLQELHGLFNSATLETIKDVETKMHQFDALLSPEVVEAYKPDIRVAFIEKAEADEISREVIKATYHGFIQKFRETVVDEAADLRKKLPSREKELREIAEAEAKDKEKAKLLKEQQQKREKEETERLKREAAEREQKEKEAAKLAEESAKMDGLFNATAETSGDEQKNVRKSLEIVIKHPQAYLPIFQFWFEKEGSKLPIDKLERFTLQRMQAFCEKWATNEGETIESPYMEYKEKIKTIAKA